MRSNRAEARNVVVLSVFAVLAVPVAAQQVPVPDVADDLAALAAGDVSAGVSPLLLKSKGKVNVWVALEDPPLAVAQANAENRGLSMSGEDQRSHLEQLNNQQDFLALNAAFLGARELGRVSKAHNAVAFSIDAKNIPALAAQPGVVTVRPVIDYQLALTETVPYIGAAAVQNAGVTGAGIRVAVIDTGIDYTHKNLGGSGTAADYTAAFGTSLDDPRNKTVNPALFPTAKVIGGYDFVGEHWPLGPLAPDPNPIACGGVPGCTDGFGHHGSHVADIIGGRSNDGGHKGVAPGAQLYALKACSSVSNACSGVALLQAMDFALDPDGDGDLSDAVNVINMSLGSNYGQKEDDLAEASENAARLGVVVVAAAGNAADHPYIVSSPSSAPGAISVAQTHVPSAKFYPLVINSPASIAGTYKNTATVDWAPIGSGFVNQPVAYVGRGCPAGSVTPSSPDDPYLANPAGKVALIDRGACSVSLKVDRAARAGAIGVLVGLVAPGDPISFSFGGGTQFVPTLVITQADSNRIKSQLVAGVSVTVHDSSPLVKSVVSSSARGPSYSYQTIKPEIGAPGASVSAIAGTGTGAEAFGGTSGATPMIAGSAALLLEAFPEASAAEIKARLMNNTETQILTAPNLFEGQLAPATRIGAGEVRVDRALSATTIAWVPEDETAAVSFGYAAVPETQEFHKTIRIFNRSNSSREYSISADFRDSSSQATAAVEIAPSTSSIEVGPLGLAQVGLSLRVDPSKLATWTLNGGSEGGNGQLLNRLELDGHLTIRDANDTVRLPWTLLSHKAADVSSDDDQVQLSGGSGSLPLSNHGAAPGRVEVFAWTGSSAKIPPQFLPQPGDNFAIINLARVGVRLANTGLGPAAQFAIHTFGKRPHPNYPAEFDICINTDPTCSKSGFLVFNAENGGFGASGQNVTFVANLNVKPVTVSAVAFTDADLNSSNVIMTVPLVAMPGLTTSSQLNFSILAFDNYFTGNLTDSIEGMTFNLATPRFIATGVPAAGVPVGGTSTLTVTEVAGGAASSPSQTGLLLLYRDAAKRQAQAFPVGVDGNQ